MIETVIGAITAFTLHVIDTTGYAGIFVLMALESANIPIPSEIIMPFSGFLTVRDHLAFWPVVFWGAFGNLIGSLVSYAIAYRYGSSRIVLRILLINTHDLERGGNWFRKYGTLTAFVSRLIPIVRTFISFPAGMFRVPLWKFSVFTFVGSFIWSFLLTGIGVLLGENWHAIEGYFRQLQYVIAVAILAGAAYWIYHHIVRRDHSSDAKETVY